jgi:hypothetical protein
MGDHRAGAVLGIFLLPQLGSRVIAGWLHNRAGSSVLIAGLFHSMHNATVNSTGLVAVVGLPQFEVSVIMDGIVVLAAAIITSTPTRSRRRTILAEDLGKISADQLGQWSPSRIRTCAPASGRRWGWHIHPSYVMVMPGPVSVRVEKLRARFAPADGEDALWLWLPKFFW